jgi:hypothetical protein
MKSRVDRGGGLTDGGVVEDKVVEESPKRSSAGSTSSSGSDHRSKRNQHPPLSSSSSTNDSSSAAQTISDLAPSQTPPLSPRETAFGQAIRDRFGEKLGHVVFSILHLQGVDEIDDLQYVDEDELVAAAKVSGLKTVTLAKLQDWILQCQQQVLLLLLSSCCMECDVNGSKLLEGIS